MAEVKILDVRKIPSMKPDRIGKHDHVVTYQTDPASTFIVVIPSEEFNESRLREEIRKDQAEREKFVGKTFSI